MKNGREKYQVYLQYEKSKHQSLLIRSKRTSNSETETEDARTENVSNRWPSGQINLRWNTILCVGKDHFTSISATLTHANTNTSAPHHHISTIINHINRHHHTKTSPHQQINTITITPAHQYYQQQHDPPYQHVSATSRNINSTRLQHNRTPHHHTNTTTRSSTQQDTSAARTVVITSTHQIIRPMPVWSSISTLHQTSEVEPPNLMTFEKTQLSSPSFMGLKYFRCLFWPAANNRLPVFFDFKFFRSLPTITCLVCASNKTVPNMIELLSRFSNYRQWWFVEC